MMGGDAAYKELQALWYCVKRNPDDVIAEIERIQGSLCKRMRLTVGS
jgi:hypothetical protein